MRHIPEDELHAYLDQALSRSQCVEIESHLAGCTQCQDNRDGIAALRDRTTALLSTLAPPRRFTPAFEVLQERAAARSAKRAGRWRAAAWAASVVAALGLGWAGRSVNERMPASVPAPELAVTRDAVPMAPTIDSAAPVPATVELADAGEPQAAPGTGTSAEPRAGRRVERPAAPAPVAAQRTGDRAVAALADTFAPVPGEPVGTMLSSGQLLAPNLDAATGTVFRTVSWDNVQRERGASVPRIAGLPVMEVQVGTSGQAGGKPMVVVAQQLESGQVIRTIEGPATDVNKLLASRRNDTGSPWPTLGDSAGLAGGDGAMAYRRGDRILAITAALPSDSLRAMIRRLNVTER